METLGSALARAVSDDQAAKAPRVNPIAVLLRNIVFLLVVLFHGFRRLAPPY
jgi:ADP-ribosyl-[dinitrogen reductase] hydrolase